MDVILKWACFSLLTVVLMVAPWLFGAWEMWWFWPFAVLLFLSTMLFALRCLLATGRSRIRWESSGPDGTRPFATIDVHEEKDEPPWPSFSRLALTVTLSAVPFLVYALIRWHPTPVFMDAERSVLRYGTAWLLGLQIAFGFDRKQRRLFFGLLFLNLGFLGLYGIVNHFAFRNAHVLWRPGYPQYQVGTLRATGSYFCPDHFSGLMELGLAAAVGVLCARDRAWPWKTVGMLLLGIGLTGVVLSKSRGGGLTVLVTFLAAGIGGLGQWWPRRRWYLRFCGLLLVAVAGAVFWRYGTSYRERFLNAEGWGRGPLYGRTWRETATRLWERAQTTSRGMMIAGALRAWRTQPWWGIGPGMHQNLWPHFAASEDGDRRLGIWPSRPCNTFHSYEVHSDWVQLLEEYGVVGLVLFLLPAGILTGALLLGLRRERLRRMQNEWETVDGEDHAAMLTAWLSCVAMGFHSLGDFNLQIPATAWMLAAWVGLGLAQVMRQHAHPVPPAGEMPP